jgi:hypothetical protein
MYGGFWRCIACGFHTEADVPPQPRIARSEQARAYYSLFDYAGPEKHWRGLRLRGRLLPSKTINEKQVRFDLGCPFGGCSRRQSAVKGQQSGTWKAYQCGKGHRIYLDLENLSWQ